MRVLLHLVNITILLINGTEAARILAVFPVPSISHQVVFRPLTQELVKRGHEVTVITTHPAFPKGGPPNLTEINIYEVSFKIWHESLALAPKGNSEDLLYFVKLFLDIGLRSFDAQLSHEGFKTLLKTKDEKFDLVMTEAGCRIVLGLSSVYKVPVIQVSSLGSLYGNFDTIGAPIHPILYTSISRLRVHNLTIWEQILEVYYYYRTAKLHEKYVHFEDAVLQKHLGNDIPSLTELSNNVEMLVLNVHPVFLGIRPVPLSVVHMGGIHQKSDEELPEDLKAILDSSKSGVIYVSFGTNVDTSHLAEDKIRIIVNVLSRLPYDVLFKWDSEELPGRTENIRIAKWWPQSDLLKHSNIKLFITQGGLQSTDEAIIAGVPLVGIPMFGDQWANVERYEYHKIGVKVNMITITEDNFRNAIYTVIEDESYRQNVINLRSLIHDQPQRPLERAVWWIEHMVRHGSAKHFRSPAANMTWTQYFEIELVFIVLIGLFVTLFSFIFLVYLVGQYVVYILKRIRSRLLSLYSGSKCE